MRPLCALLAVLSIAAAGVLQCAQRREISPCSCQNSDKGVQLKCERVGSYASIAAALRDRFPRGMYASLAITHSDLRDFVSPTLAELGLNITRLELNYNNISYLDDVAFVGLTAIEYFSIGDNELPTIPKNVLKQMPNIRTLDLGRNNFKVLTSTDLEDLPNLNFLMLGGNEIVSIEKNSLPPHIRQLHMGRNKLKTLNGTLLHLDELKWLMLPSNMLSSLDNEFSMNARNMSLINAAHNCLEGLPRELQYMPDIGELYFYNNSIKALNGTLKKSRNLVDLNLSFNQLKYLAHDDFEEALGIKNLDLSYNRIQALNGALTKLSQLRYLNLTHNELSEFSIQEIGKLNKLLVADLSHNKIEQLNNYSENNVDIETYILEIWLNHNRLKDINGGLVGVRNLVRLNISHNYLETLLSDDLIGLDHLKILDISHNHIKTLEDASKASLPKLEELFASFNKITVLDRDFEGLPMLCIADLSYNNVESINYEIALHSKCSIHGVTGTLKIFLHENPAVCNENYQNFATFMEKKLHARLYGECAQVKVIPTYAPTAVVPSSLLNDVVPLGENLLITTIDGKQTKWGVGSKFVHIIPGLNGDYPVVLYPPITISPVFNASSPTQNAQPPTITTRDPKMA